MLCGRRSRYWNSDYYYDLSRSLYDRHQYFSRYVQKILEAGAKPDPNDLNNALMVCAKKSDFKGNACLMRYGGDYCKKDENGKSILHLCWLECKSSNFLSYTCKKLQLILNDQTLYMYGPSYLTVPCDPMIRVKCRTLTYI